MDGRGIEGFQIDIDEIDERPILLVRDIAAVQDVVFVDADGDRDPAQRERACETVRIRIVMTDYHQILGAGEELFEPMDGMHTSLL